MDIMHNKDNSSKTGRLSIKDKFVITVFGKFCLWLGNRLLSIETYEDMTILEGEAKESMNTIDTIMEKHEADTLNVDEYKNIMLLNPGS